MQLTSNTNHYFVYYIEISSTEYPTFQKQRELNCDFAAFSVYVVKLLNDVIESKRQWDEGQEDGSVTKRKGSAYIDLPEQLVAEFDYSTKTFTFLQNSAMKITRFLYFDLIEGNDAAIKEYLAGRLQLSLDTIEEMDHEAHAAAESLALEKAVVEALQQEKRALQQQWAEERDALIREKNDVVSQYSTKLATMQTEGEQALLQQRREYTSEIESLKTKLDTMEERYTGNRPLVSCVMKVINGV